MENRIGNINLYRKLMKCKYIGRVGDISRNLVNSWRLGAAQMFL